MRALIVAVVLLVPAVRAAGHAFAPALLELHERGGGRVGVVWKPPATRATTLAPVLPAACRTVDGALGAPGTTAHLRLRCAPSGLAGAIVGVDGLEGPGAEALVRVVRADGGEDTWVLRGAGARVAIAAAPAAAAVARRWLRLGIAHILAGPDHLLLLAGLLLLVRGAGALLRTVTAFTLAHSLTLALATLDVLRLPQRPVEALVAASLVLVALELIRPPGAPATLLRARPWLAAFALGLLHGLGFAGALAEVGLPPAHRLLALLAFNGGVEVGQLAFLVAIAAPVALLGRAAAARPWLRAVPAYGIGAVAVRWTLERLGG